MTTAGIASARATPRVAGAAAQLRGRDLRLALVAVVYTVLQLVLVSPGHPLAWDESIYFSQVDPRSPAAFFSAPRSRGVTLLGAPVALFTSDPTAIRVFLAVLSGLALFASFAVWRRLIGGGTTALAALLFATLWVSLDYGPELMPNLWVAFAAVAATGLFLRTVREGPDARLLLGIGFAVGWATLVRANDGVYLALPLLVAAAAVRSWRRPAVAAAITGGLAAGLVEWVIEAYVRFGGVLERLSDAAGVEGGMGVSWNLGHVLRSANGPVLCRPCTTGEGPAWADLWAVAIPVLAAVALVVAARLGRRPLATAALPAVCALSLSASYLFMINYSAPRFFLPAFALLSLPIAALLTRGLRAARNAPTPARIAACVLVGGLLLANMAEQQVVLRHQVDAAVRDNGQYRALGLALNRIGIKPPCLVAGETQPVAYNARCASSISSDVHTDASAASGPAVIRAAEHENVAILVGPGGSAPDYAPGWRRVALHGSPLVKGWSAYVPPTR
ncbi:glycosyltransferase family 39 protein [Streptomyces sp. RB6PN25]|uniref:Glycosyltransferase family 39 protein n=1 Tax=Streptomyces humicola TaxID=2953240 RepID=A0ABT1PXK6_9ACTN|nr:glycosyltransferase family 39 protein [Streptomyces humicola]MCQ4082401.1 glycosyltransferase family 39 protein [Streptomyces humicola]